MPVHAEGEARAFCSWWFDASLVGCLPTKGCDFVMGRMRENCLLPSSVPFWRMPRQFSTEQTVITTVLRNTGEQMLVRPKLRNSLRTKTSWWFLDFSSLHASHHHSPLNTVFPLNVNHAAGALTAWKVWGENVRNSFNLCRISAKGTWLKWVSRGWPNLCCWKTRCVSEWSSRVL